MKPSSYFSSLLLVLMTSIFFVSSPVGAQAQKNWFQIKIYSLKNKAQEERMDQFLGQALIPALNRQGISKVGVFKPIANDTAPVRKIYVLLPFTGLDQWQSVEDKLAKDQAFQGSGQDYINAPYNDPPYQRIESILLDAFDLMPQVGVPDLKGPIGERIYELRSYEGATEKIHQNKVRMFNAGDEVGLFKRLGFNAVFYAETRSGCHMPNLMYMTSFENMEAHDQHWKSFSSDPAWKSLSALPEFQNNVSHIDIVLMHPAPYSQL
jgi:hypothetical protein